MCAKPLKTAYLKPSSPSGGLNYAAPDLTRHPPRSPRTRLGGFVHLPRLIDKARATLSGKNGDFHYDCPMDQRFFAFTGIKASEFMRQVKAGKGDGALLSWVMAHLRPRRTESEIVAWSSWYEQRVPSAVEGRGFFNEVHKKNAPKRDDISTWFDWLELDDYVTFGGKA
jgi:hypothetical protein